MIPRTSPLQSPTLEVKQKTPHGRTSPELPPAKRTKLKHQPNQRGNFEAVLARSDYQPKNNDAGGSTAQKAEERGGSEAEKLHQKHQRGKSQNSTDTPTVAGESFKRSKNFDEILLNSTPFTLLPSLRGVSIPDHLTDEQKTRVHRLLKKYNPELLTSHPIVNSEGKPVVLTVDLNSVKDFLFLQPYELSTDQKETVSSMFNDYPAHLRWLNEHVEVRTITSIDVPKHEKLVGQGGVFLKQDVKGNTFYMMFDGMLLEIQEDIENDKKLRKLAGCDNYYSKSVSQEGHVLEGMGVSMKLNAATKPSSMYSSSSMYSLDDARTNLKAYSIHARHNETGEQCKFILFKTNRDVIKDEQLCFPYDINSER